MADRCNTPNCFLRDTNSKLAIPLPQANAKKNSFLEQLFGIASLVTSGRRSLLGFIWGLTANSSSGDLHGIYIKQSKARLSVSFGFLTKTKARFWRPWFLNRLYNSKRLQFVDKRPWTGSRRWRWVVYMCGTNKLLKNLISESCFFFNFFFCPLYYLILYEK